jgi:hypothetical protein
LKKPDIKVIHQDLCEVIRDVDGIFEDEHTVMKSTKMVEEHQDSTDKVLEDLIQSTVSDILERDAINKQDQQVVHEQAIAVVKLSQKEQTPKQDVPKKEEDIKKKRKAKQKEGTEEGERKKEVVQR